MEKVWERCNDRTKKLHKNNTRQQFHSEFIDLKLFAFEVVDGFKDKNIALKMLYFIKNIIQNYRYSIHSNDLNA